MERHQGCGASSATEPEGQERPRAWWDPRPMGLGARTAEGVPGARRARRASLTFAGGEVVGAGHTRVTPQPCHAGPAAALPAARVAGCVQRAVRRAVAGWGDRKRVGVRRGAPPAPPPARTLTGTGGEAVVAGAALLAGGARVAGAAATQPACPADLVQGAPGVAAAGCKRQSQAVAPVGAPCPARAPAPLLTAAVGVAVVAGVAAVTVRAIKPRPAQTAASLVAALGQGPCGAAATHCGAEVCGA